jgi:hypothetical protein
MSESRSGTFEESVSWTSERRVIYLLASILALALGLRVWGITFGLPYDFTPDEIHEIVRALKLGAGEYSWIPGKGGLYYFLFVEYGLLFVFWWVTGQISGPEDFAIRYLQDPTSFYVLGRLTVALMGMATCLIIYLIGNRLYGKRTALAAAFIGATAYFHTMWSHYINVDIGMVLAVWSAILAYVIYEENRKTRWLVFAGMLGGIAFAFKLPGIVVIVPLLLAMATRPGSRENPMRVIKSAALLGVSLLGTALVVAPENILSAGKILSHFSGLLSPAVAAETALPAGEFDQAVRQVTVLRGGTYLNILLRDSNIVLTFAALAGAAFGIWRRNRWDIILTAFVVIFLTGMSLADRPGEERYMLPIVPALWLLGARAAWQLGKLHSRLVPIAIAAIVVLPIYAVAEQNHMWTRPDTRVLAKDWIESNVPENAKVLMDGMRYRFTQSPPLRPNDAAVDRRVGRAAGAAQVSRGVSNSTLELYADAMSRLDGPKYDLYSTVYGLNVKRLSYYIERCFDYIVTSSQNESRYDSPEAAEKYPVSARFYSELPNDSRFEKVFTAAPVPWSIQGPEINVYKVLQSCS